MSFIVGVVEDVSTLAISILWSSTSNSTTSGERQEQLKSSSDIKPKRHIGRKLLVKLHL